MKHTFLLVAACLSASLFSQNESAKSQETSNAEKFSARAGTLLQKEFLSVGQVKGITIQVIHYTDLINTQKQSAIKLEYEYAGKYTSDTKSAVLDADEVDGLIKSITLMQEKIFPITPVNYTEVSFKSRGGCEAGCFWSKDAWSTYLKLERYDNDSYVFLKKDDFPVLLSLLQQAKTRL